MRLSEYLATKDLTPKQFAKRLGVNHTTVYRWLNGDTIPTRENLKGIMSVTEGEVDFSDLMHALATQTNHQPRRERETHD